MKFVIPGFRSLRLAPLAISVAAVVLAGCETASKKDMAIMKSQITAIDERVAFMHKNVRAQADMAANLDELQNSVVALTGQIEELNSRIERMSEQVKKGKNGAINNEILQRSVATDLRLEKLGRDLNALTAETLAFIEVMEKRSGVSRRSHQKALEKVLAAAGAPVSTEAPAVKEGKAPEPLSPEDLYRKSYTALREGSYDEAVKGFGEFLREYPKTELSDNAAYWLGQAYLEKGDHRATADAFDAMVEEYPKSNKAPAALLKSAGALENLGEADAARERLRMILERYPTSDEALAARERLDKEAKKRKK